jgi:hypothetical protein
MRGVASSEPPTTKDASETASVSAAFRLKRFPRRQRARQSAQDDPSVLAIRERVARRIGAVASPVARTGAAGVAAEALSHSWIGATPDTSDLCVMLLYTVVAGGLAVRLFR